jgi:MFS family permease
MSAGVITNQAAVQRSKGIRAQLRIAREPGVQELVLARAASKLGIATLSYGGMVYLAREGASDITVVLVSASGYLAALLFGLQGGTLADIFPKRWALTLGMGLQALLCFLTPTLLGTEVLPLISLLFLVSAISQVTTPAMKSAVTLVTTMAEVVAVSALIGLIGSLGSAVGSTFLAPLLIRYSGIRAVMYVAGLVLAVAAVRAFRLPEDAGLSRSNQEGMFRDSFVTPKRMAHWATSSPGVASMVLVGGLVVALFEAINSLLPVYVREVLHADPALSVYIFAPAGVGFLIGTVFCPLLIRLIGERWVAAISLFCIASGAIMLGTVHEVAPTLAPYSPLRIVEPFGVDLSDSILAAGFIVIPTNFGSTAAAASVQAFINKFVPLERQGRTFGMQEVIEQALTIIALISLGGISSLAGARIVFLVSPFVVIMVGVWFVRFSYRAIGENQPERRQAAQALVTGRGLGDPEMLTAGSPSVLTKYDLRPAPRRERVPARRTAAPKRAKTPQKAKPGHASHATPPKESVRSFLMTRSVAPPTSKPKKTNPPARHEDTGSGEEK